MNFCVKVTGLARFIHAVDRPMYHIWFQFRKNMTGTRKRVAKDIRSLFILSMRRRFGGFIERLETDDAMSGLYEVHIWTRAENRDDPSLEPLWEFVTGLLEVEGFTVHVEQDYPGDERFTDRFFVSSHGDEPGDWSTGIDIADDDSVISIESIHYP